MPTAPTNAPHATDLPPLYDPTQVEPHVLERYLASKAYAAFPNRGQGAKGPGGQVGGGTEGAQHSAPAPLDPSAPPYSIVIPPPNVTAALHLGHALNNTLQDILTRVHRMRGFNTLWMPGTDHAGIATQTVVDKRLQQEGKKALKDYKQDELAGKDGRGQFIAQVTAWKDEYEAVITNQLKQMGCSCDWDRQRFTMDDQCAKAVREAFFQLFKDGLIYRGKRLVNWDPATQTALSDDEVEMETIDGNFYYMRYPVCDADGNTTGEFATVATTRPETMLGDTAVAVNPKDAPRAKYIGRFVKLPIVNRIIPIVGDDYVVIPDADSEDAKAKMASGFLKVTPAHDPNDYEIGQRHDLPIINVMAPDASISIDHGWPAEENPGENEELKPLVGLAREEARKQIVIWFKQNDLMQEVKPYRHAVGHSYRSHVPVEPYYTDQWYVKVTDDRLAGAALRAMDASQFEGDGGTGILPVVPPKTVDQSLDRSRRNLPHWEQGGSTYFVTYRVRSGELSEAERKIALDAAMHWHGERMDLHAAVVMPDHVHLLLTPYMADEGNWHSLSALLHSIKSFSANQINRVRGATGSLWLDESFDRIVRDEDEFYEKWNYIRNNPVKSGLSDEQGQYEWLWELEGEHRQDACATGEGGLKFYPERYAKTFQAWHENIRDWCISRQLWWGHRIPVWRKRVELTEINWVDELAGKSGLDDIISGQWKTAHVVFQRVRDGIVVDPKHDLNPVVAQTEGAYDIFICALSDEEMKQLEAAGFERDPDVLDTWFSSALWPLSTLGWPEQTPELATWNPTSVLCTAREIITLWVSRMVMFNKYFTSNPTTSRDREGADPGGEENKLAGPLPDGRGSSDGVSSEKDASEGHLPFKHVFIHAMIQDGHGQKMSKSLGNGVDPMDIIHSHGSDAMRFTLTKMTTQTQDVRLPVDMVDPRTGETFTPTYITAKNGYKVAAPLQEHNGSKMVSSYGVATGEAVASDDLPLARNSSEKFDEGQRFANKLWNAFRFALPLLQSDGGSPRSADSTSGGVGFGLADKWILNQLGKTIETVDKALAEYRFSDYATALYDFFWRDLCDWYVEIVKPTVKEDPAQQRVLATCLDAALRLLHPAMPFITERLWEALRGTAADIERAEGVALPDSETLIRAAWPTAEPSLRDEDAGRDFELLRSIVEAIRNARNAYKIPPRQDVEATTKAPAHIAQLILDNRAITQPLTRCVGRGVGPQIDKPQGAAAVIVGDVTVYLHDVVDTEVEKERLDKALAEKEKAVKMLEGRLSNKKYVDNAPAHLVQETRDQHAAAVKERDVVKQQLDELG
ncbi:class I tRNA ligase family protein [Phycisphaeraceae bacterium D3-23]